MTHLKITALDRIKIRNLYAYEFWSPYSRSNFGPCANGLRDIEAGLNAKPEELYHLGFREPVAKSTLADANETRDWRLWGDLAKNLINPARKLYQGETLGLDLDNTIYALDSSTIDLTMSVFPWAKFRSKKRDQTSHAIGFKGANSHLHLHFRRQTLRCEILGRVDFRTRSHIHHGQGVYRLGETASNCKRRGILCDSSQGQSAIYQIQVAIRGQRHGITQRPNRETLDSQIQRGFPRLFKESSLLRRREEKALNLFNEQLADTCVDCGQTLQKALGDRVVFQVDQRQSGNQALLWNKPERSEDANLDSRLTVFDGGHPSQKLKIAGKPAQYLADFERSSV